MTLFKVRDWWHVQCGDEGEFDSGLLCVSNIDNSPDGTDKVIVGNQEKALIQIYEPKVVLTDTNKEGDTPNSSGTLQGFRPDDLLLEYNLDSPILHIACGNFVSSLQENQLAVLHPRKLSVFSVTGSKGAVEHGTQYQMKLVYEHKLQRSSYALVTGPFGEVKGKDLLAVLSLDGVLSFFEQESFAFSRFLPGFLLPGPITYVKKTDSLVTISSSYCVESFKYRTLAVAKDPDENENEGPRIAGALQKGKRVVADWTFSLGESAIDIAVLENPNTFSVIYVLGKKNIFALKDNGTLHWMKKLDYEPCCFLPYHGFEMANMLLVCTVNRTMLVYNEQTMKWAAQLPIVPVAVRRCILNSLEGVIVTLGSEGTLASSYLGTDPSLLVAPPPLETSEINYGDAEKELRQLKAIIGGTLNDKTNLPMFSQNLSVQISVHSPPVTQGEIPSAFIACQVLVRQEKVRNVRVSFFVAPPFAVFQAVHCFPELMPGDAPTQISASVLIPDGHDNLLPSLLKIKVTAVYYNDSDTLNHIDNGTVPHLVESAASLPIVIALQATAPLKVAAYKLTLDTNKPCVDLQKLFPELSWEGLVQENAIAFQFRNTDAQNPAIVSILASKTSQRYRIQGSTFGSLWLPTDQLIQRLIKYYYKEKNFKIGLPSSGGGAQLPLAEFMAEIEDHYRARKQKQQLDQMLAQSASQFRIIQKRLLVRTKDKSALPLNNLDVLLEASYHQLLNLSEAAWRSLIQIETTGCSLACSASLVKTLAILQQKEGTMVDVQRTVLEASLSDLSLYNSISGSEQGWEEHTLAALLHLINPGENGHTLGKGKSLSFLQPQDLARLRKHLTLVLMKTSKGTLIPKNKDPEEDEEKKEDTSPEDEPQRDVGDIDL